MELGFEEQATPFVSGAQNARVMSEAWVGAWFFCPNCGAERVRQFPNNRPAADFHCETCAEEFELKSQKAAFGPRVLDGAYQSLVGRLAAANNPNFILMSYDLSARAVRDLMVVPKHFFTPEVIERRKPLSPTARRAGWVGCNILLRDIPEAGKVHIVRAGLPQPRQAVLEKWRAPLFLRQEAGAARGWLIEVMKCVEAIGRPPFNLADFTLADVYAFEDRLARAYPGNHNVRPKIRQQLQVLRDGGYLEFMGKGLYRLSPSAQRI